MKIINFKEKKKEIFNGWATEIIRKYRDLLYLSRKFKDKSINDKRYHKVRDDDYNAGEYRGAANSTCNLKYSLPKEIP